MMSSVVLPFAIAFATSLLLTPVVRGLARRANIVAKPVSDRWHRQPTALLGGVAIFGGFAASVALMLALDGNTLSEMPASSIAVLAAATLLFITGLVDDRIHMRPASKLALQVVGAVIIVSSGITYPVTPWPLANMLATIFWFLAITNALNLLDNMDGVSAGVAAIAAIFLAAVLMPTGNAGLVAVCAALAGAALGFLPYNFHPASIFMGDSGSLFLGAVLASVGAAFPATASRGIIAVLFVPAFIVIVPILDTLLVTTTRTLAGRSIAEGGRDHTSHRLVALGVSERGTALLLYAFAAIAGCLGLAIGFQQEGFGVLGVLFMVLLALGAAYLARMKVYSPSQQPAGRVTVLVSQLLFKRHALELLMDVVLFGTAWYAAHLLRWDFAIPQSQMLVLEQAFGVVVAAYVVAFAVLGVYRGEWQRISISDAHRLAKATGLGMLLATAAIVILFREAEFARSALLLNALLVLVLTAAARLTFRSADLMRRAWRQDGTPVLIYGAGGRGEIVARELLANRAPALLPVGFVDDDLLKAGRVIHGLPVFGGIERVELLIRTRRIGRVLLAADLDAERHALLAMLCAANQVELAKFTFEFQVIDVPRPQRIAATRLAVE